MTKKKNNYVISVKQGEQSNYIFEVTVTPEQKQACHQAVLLEYQKEAVQPGFRKGHVPLAMVEKLANPANIFMASLEEIVNGAIQQIMEEHGDKRWIGQIYNLDTSKINNNDTEGVLSFHLDVFPEVQAKNDAWKKHKVEKYSTEVTQEDIDATVDQLRSSYASFDDVDVVTDTSLMRLKITFLDKEGTDLGHGKNQYLWHEELAEHSALHKKFLKKKKGDVVALDYKKASAIALLNYKGENTPETVSCEILDIKQKVLPELNQEFIDKTFSKDDGISSVEVLKEKIKETLTKNKEESALYEWVDNYLTAIDGSFEVAIPQTLIDEELKNRLHHLGKQLGGEKWLKAYLDRMGKEEADKYVDTIRQASLTSIHKYFLLKYVADELQLDIDRNNAQANGEVEKKLYEKLVG